MHWCYRLLLACSLPRPWAHSHFARFEVFSKLTLSKLHSLGELKILVYMCSDHCSRELITRAVFLRFTPASYLQATEQLQSQWQRVVKLLKLSPERQSSLVAIANTFANSIDELLELDGAANWAGKRHLVAAQESKIDILGTWSNQLETMRQELELLELCSQLSKADTKTDVTPKLVPASLLSPDILTLTPDSKAVDSTSRKRPKTLPSSSCADTSGCQPCLAKERDDDLSWHTAASLSSTRSTVFIGQESPLLQCMHSGASGSSCYNLADRFNNTLGSSIPMLSEPPTCTAPQATLSSLTQRVRHTRTERLASNIPKQRSGISVNSGETHAPHSTSRQHGTRAPCADHNLANKETNDHNDLEDLCKLSAAQLWDEVLQHSSAEGAVDPDQLIDLLCGRFLQRSPTATERCGSACMLSATRNTIDSSVDCNLSSSSPCSRSRSLFLRICRVDAMH
jgi:hypothetical protein